MSKVKLPIKIIDAIEKLREDFSDNGLYSYEWLTSDIDDNEEVRKYKDIILEYINVKDNFNNDSNLIKYYKALTNGYEAENILEEDIRKVFLELVKKADESDINSVERHYYNGMWKGFKKALDLANIKIKDVNI